MKQAFVFAVIIFLIGCSSPDTQPNAVPYQKMQPSWNEGPANKGEKVQPDLKTINVLLYSTKHPEKAQPMLIQVISDPNEIEQYESKLKSKEAAELPLQEVTDLYYLQLEYVGNGVSDYKDILYAKSSGNKAYYKEFKMSPKYNLEKLDEKMKESLLQTMGSKGWYLLPDPLPI